jgi:hypothetical protein
MKSPTYDASSRIISALTHGRIAVAAQISSKRKFVLLPNVTWQLDVALQPQGHLQETLHVKVSLTRGSFISRATATFGQEIRLWNVPAEALAKLGVPLADAYAYAVNVGTPLTTVINTLLASALAENTKLFLAFKQNMKARNTGRLVLNLACGRRTRLQSYLDVQLGHPEKDGRRKMFCGTTFGTDIGFLLP